jgi:hypothetical protein
LLKAKK